MLFLKSPLSLLDSGEDFRTFFRHVVILTADSSSSSENGSSKSPRADFSSSVVASVSFIVSFLRKAFDCDQNNIHVFSDTSHFMCKRGKVKILTAELPQSLQDEASWLPPASFTTLITVRDI